MTSEVPTLQCNQCASEIPESAEFCGDCGAQQGSATGWFEDPTGRWEARYFDNGQMTKQVQVGDNSYAEPSLSFADSVNSRIEEILLDGERLLHEVWANWNGTTKTGYAEDRGILALTSYRALKYHTGKGDKSTKRGEGQITLHWDLALNPQYLDLLRQAAAAGDRTAKDMLYSGLHIISGYESRPFKKVGRNDPDIVGSKKITLFQKTVRDEDQAPPRPFDSVGGALGSVIRFNRRLGEAHNRYVHSVTHTGKWTGFGQSKLQNKDLALDLVGPTPTLLRIDEMLTSAAEAMANE